MPIREHFQNEKKWSEKNIELGFKGELWTARKLSDIESYIKTIRVENNIAFGKGNIDHVIDFPNGDILILDSKNWSTIQDKYLVSLGVTLNKEGTFLARQRHAHHLYLGAVFHKKYIPDGIRKTKYGYYMINPNYLGKFIKEIANK